MFALLHDSYAGQPHHWSYQSHAVGCRVPVPLPSAVSALLLPQLTDTCASVLQPLTGDRVIDRTYVGHQAPTQSSFCSPVNNTWANGMRPHFPPSKVLAQETFPCVVCVGARNFALCDCVCMSVSVCVCVCACVCV